MEPVAANPKGNGVESRGTRALAIIAGAVIVFVGLLVLVILVGIGEGDRGVHYDWSAWFFGLLAFSFLVLPIIVPGAFLIMRGIRGGPFVLRTSARRTVRRTGRRARLLGVVVFVAGLVMGEDNPAQGVVIYLSLNLLMIGMIISLIAFAGRPKRSDDEVGLTAGRSSDRFGASYGLPEQYESVTTVSDAADPSIPE